MNRGRRVWGFGWVLVVLGVEVASAQVPGVDSPATRPATELVAILADRQKPHEDKWAAVQELRSLGRKASGPLLDLLATSDSPDTRYYIIRALGYLRDPLATEALSNILLDRSCDARRYAATALGQIRDPRAVGALRNALGDVRYVREDALDALVKIDSTDARVALESYHFANPASELRLSVSCDKAAYRLGEQIRVTVTLTNASDKPVLLLAADGQEFGYLVFQRRDEAFIEQVDTGWREGHRMTPIEPRRLDPRGTLRCSLIGHVDTWTRGEKDDHAFVPTEHPFLTLDFRWVAFHIRMPGEYKVRAVFKQDSELLDGLRQRGLREDTVRTLWQGKAVSNPADLVVGRPTTGPAPK